ncbi:DUF1345 domain-containing protein [Allokutzneria oryzae]|uniref:DUF1345 domain-containing protein n=1 Tax=Allokutzneria oryzae TaxID=1378989 RepID=A0ABV5ZRS3_9PSEU
MARRRLIYRWVEFALIAVGAAVFVAEFSDVSELLVLVAWDVVAVFYLGLRWLRVRRHRDGQDSRWVDAIAARHVGSVSSVLAGFVGLGAGFLIVLADRLDSGLAVQAKLVGVPAILFGWLILHFGYSDRYAHLHYLVTDEDGLRFLGTGKPNALDFAYFSFTVGVSFAVSDVEVHDRRVRYVVLVHSVLSFLYNTAILGIAIGVLTGR